MKKLLLIIVVIVVGLGYFALRNGTNEAVPGEPVVNDGFRPDPSNAIFIFDEGPITLKEGRREVEVAPGSAMKEETLLTDFVGYGDLNNDGKNDAAAILVQSGGASGVFIYLAGYVSGPVTYKGTNAIFLGDRVTPKSISINDGAITVNYLDRKEGEPFAAEPTVSVTRNFQYQGGTLIEK